jgi:hypothetical protein
MRDKRSGVNEQASFGCQSKSGEMSQAIAMEAQGIVHDAARPVAAGDTVKAQMRNAWVALGRPPMWRVRAAWYGDAGSWSAEAFEDLRMRYRVWRDRQEAIGRERASINRECLAKLREQLSQANPDLYRDAIDRIDQALGPMGNARSDSGAEDRAGTVREK